MTSESSNCSCRAAPASLRASVSSASMRRSCCWLEASSRSSGSPPQVVGGLRAAQRPLEQGAVQGERGAQFVGGVGHEMTLGIERALEAFEQVIESGGEVADSRWERRG